MYLTLSKRFEFSASHRLYNPKWSAEQNSSAYGDESGGEHGHGHNYVAHLVFHGPVDPDTGMMLNIATIKSRVKTLLESRYDHKYLNEDTLPFHRTIPTAENIASQILHESESLFVDDNARPVACRIEESPETAAISYASGLVERQFSTWFSAARRTMSPHLSDVENTALYGVSSAPLGHGHQYRLLVTLTPKTSDTEGITPSEAVCYDAVARLKHEFDHTNLNHLPQLKGIAITTECLARYFFEYLQTDLPVVRIRLWETPDLSVEYDQTGQVSMCLSRSFHAAHRLNSDRLGDIANRELYGKCNNLRGHGHTYTVESTVSGAINERTGALMSLDTLIAGTEKAIAPWRYKHLDAETDEFIEKPSTGENILLAFYPKLQDSIGMAPSRVRLWETPNNRFCLRAVAPQLSKQ
jgi:6-pyruvoyltetrahydropterin/6-carboxytetrahydropterin synthase